MSEFDKFVEGLPNNQEDFDVKGEIPSGSQAENTIEDKPSLDGENNQDENDLPFDKNPKIKKFIERQIKKRLGELDSKLVQREEVYNRKDTANDSDVPYEWLAMYGDNEDTRKAWKFQEKLLNDYKTQARQEALDAFRSEQERERAETEQAEEFIDNSLEELEESYGIDLTSKAPAARKARTEFLDLVQRLSPKDTDGNITSYVDFNEAFELYQSRKQVSSPETSRKQSLASRSMAKSSDAPAPKEEYEKGMGFEGVARRLGL